ncbi:hypothetical protein K458DRAFT_326558 [Lentithecium fluviatile CBS 122367]|uniref:Alcohol acetyltransferase n=1 Tax=Lentithecium fluviatile CBS 122367 TaxID=1168545 RepID=A0A6G1JKQ7_9PLEO|nr:hypothetical protein K458DRAFT_326558 [Lentithecium fluviatile CBS 122367]
MGDVRQLQKLRPLGKLEQLSSVCHHLGFYHNVGLSAHYQLSKSSSVSDVRRLIYAALADVIRKHGILFAIPVDEDSPDAYFARLPSIDLTSSVFFIRRSQPVTVGGEDRELDAILQEQHNTNFKSEYGTLPFWRLLVLQEPGVEHDFTASFIFHHSIGDGVAGLIFHKEFQDALEAASSLSVPRDFINTKVAAPNDTTLLLPLEELHPLPINSNPVQFPTTGLKEWTGNPIRAPCVTQYRSLYLSPSSSKAFIQECKKKSLSLTSVLPSIIAASLFDILPPTIEALTCIIPVNLRPWLHLPRSAALDAIGTFIDAFKVQLRHADHSADNQHAMLVPPAARETSEKIKKYLTDNLSPSGEPYTAIAVFKTIPDVSVVFNSTLGNERDAAFEVSNLGAFTGSTKLGANAQWHVGRVTFSRSSVVSGSAVTMSVVSGGDGALTIGFSWQEGIVDDDVVDRLIEGVRRYFEAPEAANH